MFEFEEICIPRNNYIRMKGLKTQRGMKNRKLRQKDETENLKEIMDESG